MNNTMTKIKMTTLTKMMMMMKTRTITMIMKKIPLREGSFTQVNQTAQLEQLHLPEEIALFTKSEMFLT